MTASLWESLRSLPSAVKPQPNATGPATGPEAARLRLLRQRVAPLDVEGRFGAGLALAILGICRTQHAAVEAIDQKLDRREATGIGVRIIGCDRPQRAHLVVVELVDENDRTVDASDVDEGICDAVGAARVGEVRREMRL